MKNMQKLWPLSLVALWGATSSFINLGVSSDAIEAPTGAPAPVTATQAPQDAPKCERGTAFITVDGLLWKAQESGLSYATATKPEHPGSPQVGKGKIKDLEFQWDYGFRTGLGFNIPHGNYDTYFNYTWFRDTAKGNTNNGGNMTVLPGFVNPCIALNPLLSPGPYPLTAPTTTATATAHWKLHLNVLDWELGKLFVPYQWFSFRPFLGVKAAWVHQNYDVDYGSLTSGVGTVDYSVTMKNNYWGVGPTGGFTSQFWLGNGFSIFGKAAVSLVYGSFTLEHSERGVIPLTGMSMTVADLSDHYGAGRAITDLAIGLGWDTKFCKDRFHFSIAAGWEQHIYFEQGEFMRFNDPSNGGHFTQEHSDLSLQGGTLSAKFQF